HLVAKGMLNATRRSSLTDPEPLTPGEIVGLEIDIDTTAWRFAKGHRVRLAIASADWPNVWPTPEPATNTVHRGSANPSRLVLPTVPPMGSATPPSFSPSPKEMTRHSDRTDPPTWEVVHDALSGRSQVRIGEEHDERIDATTVVHREYSLLADCDPANPGSASARGRHTSRITRPASAMEGSSDVLIQATATHFHVTIDLELRVNGTLHHSRRWVESVPRILL
ncbi:MAG: hypothetical protein L0206_21530, partial [Actinobacteria bacterium]|nr:hypothetical protein [Actinomycetota bacterium]